MKNFKPPFSFFKNENTEGVLKSPFLRTRRCLGGIAVFILLFPSPRNLYQLKKALPLRRISTAVGMNYTM